MDTYSNIQPYTIEEVPNPQAPQQPVTEVVEQPEENFLTRSKRKPFLIFIVVFVVIGLIIFAYLLIQANRSPANQGDGNNNGDNGDSNRQVVLQWWGLFLDEEVVQPLIDEYQDENPNVTIEYANKRPSGSSATALKTYQDELDRVLSSNDSVQQPDIFMVHNSWVGDYELYSRSSTSYDLQTFINTFHPAVATDLAATGQVYGVPLWLDSLAIVYNKDLLAEKSQTIPPTRWPELKNLAETLTVRNGSVYEQGGFSGGTANNVSFAYELLVLLMMQNGVQMTSSQTLQPTFAQASTMNSAINAVQFYLSFVGNEPTWNSSFKNDSAEFLEGDLAMDAVTSWRLRDILNYNQSESLGLDIGVAQMPQIVGQGQDIINIADYWANMVALNRPNTTASWDFLEWITQPAQLQKLSDNTKTIEGQFGLVSPRKDMSEVLVNDPFLKVYNESAPNAKSWYTVKGMEVAEILRQLITSGGATSGAITSAQEDIIELIDQKGDL